MEDLMTYETKYIEIHEVDDMGEYFFWHLLNRFSQIATVSATQLGVWNEEMMNQYGWVVAKQYLHLEEPICYHDTIELSTTIAQGSFVSFPRYYFIKKGNRQIGTCSSVWTLIDIHKRRMVVPQKIGIVFPKVTHDIVLAMPPNIEKDIPMSFVKERQVLYSDVDVNRHMNNTRYIQWAMDLIDYEVHHRYFISDLNIQYRKEIRPLEKVRLFMGNDEQRYVIEGRNLQDDIYFTIDMVFQRRKV